MFATDKVRDVRTNSVQGEFSAPEALNRLLAGTPLHAIPEQQTGGFAVARIATNSKDDNGPNGQRAAQTSDRPDRQNGATVKTPTDEMVRRAAQSTRGTASEEKDEAAIVLTPFEVKADVDNGYSATSTLAGTRLRTDLRDVGAAVSVITAEFMQDTASTDLKDLLVYTTSGEAGGFGGNTSGVDTLGGFSSTEGMLEESTARVRIRGLASADLTRDFFRTVVPMDSYNTGRVEISRGANAMLFGLGSPAGIVNNQLEYPRLRKNKFQLTTRAGRYGSYRGVVDADVTIVPSVLGIRVIGLNEKDLFRQDPAFGSDKRVYASAVVQPRLIKGEITQVKVALEHGRLESSRPRPTPPQDGITPWFNVLNKVAIAPDGTLSGQAAAVISAETGRWFGVLGAVYTDPQSNTQGGSGVPAFMQKLGGPLRWFGIESFRLTTTNPEHFLNQRNAPAGEAWSGLWRDQELLDSSVFDFYNHLLEGPNRRSDEDFKALTATLRQTFFRGRAGFELAYDRQSRERLNLNTLDFDASTVNIDFNTALTDGTPNPNFGRPYIAAETNANAQDQTNDARRATVFATLDFTDRSSWLKHLGRHVFNAVYSEDETKNFRRAFAQFRYDLGLNQYRTGSGYADSAAIYYLGPSLANRSSASGAYIGGLKARMIPQASGEALIWDERNVQWRRTTVNTLNWRDDIDRLYEGASRNRQKAKSTSAVWQSYLMHHTIVGTVGWRRDKFDSFLWSGVPLAAVTGEALPFDPSWTEPASPGLSSEKDTISWSVVLHAPRWAKNRLPRGMDVSLSYNESENFRPSSQVQTVYGQPLPPPSGTTKDYGVILSFLDRKINFRAVKYETVQNFDNITFINDFFIGNGLFRNFLSQLDHAAVNEKVINKWFGFQPGHPNYLPLRASLNTPNPPGGAAPLTAAETAARTAWFSARTDAEWLARMDPLIVSGWVMTRQPGSANNWVVTRPPGVGQNANTISRGLEFELTLNPTSNWRITMNASKTEALRNNAGEDLREFIGANNVFWFDGNGVIANSTADQDGFEDVSTVGGINPAQSVRTIAQTRIVSPWINALASNGQPVQEMVKWRYNLVNNYSFTRGALKGFNVGGALRWRDKVAVGYPALKSADGTWVYDITRPYFGPRRAEYDAWAGYRRKFAQGKYEWSIQANVRDLFGRDRLIPVTAQPNGAIASSRIPNPNIWSITNTFSF